MKSLPKKNKFIKFLQAKPTLIFLVFLLLFFGWNVIHLFGKMNQTIKNRKNAEEKINELNERKEELLFDLEKLESSEGIEETLREDYGLAKKGEGLIIILEEEKTEESSEKLTNSKLGRFLDNIFK